MTVDEFRDLMNAASRGDRLAFVMWQGAPKIAVGLDSGRGLALLHPRIEAPLEEITPA